MVIQDENSIKILQGIAFCEVALTKVYGRWYKVAIVWTKGRRKRHCKIFEMKVCNVEGGIFVPTKQKT